jgi:hypothetical protein
MYRSKLLGGEFSEPVPVNFLGRNVPGQPGAIKGYHANDMSIVHPKSTGEQNSDHWAYMYHTCLPNHFYLSDETKESSTKNNLTCWATSPDDGETWTVPANPQIVLLQNGLDGSGAWSPSAILSKDESEIWIHYSRNEPIARVLRSRVAMDGFTRLGAPEEMKDENCKPLTVSNVDISLANGVFYLAGNLQGESPGRLSLPEVCSLCFHRRREF